ncbi:hypothetical protein [Barnesiella propionica]|uniref:hypothetical protein n=1 Tax=Barnesiella propionica TaxID=2981781 RepID=UPI0021D2DF3B|nr:hypothetical protein [Barnesiella propionica]
MLLDTLADLLYRTIEVFRRAVTAIFEFATSQYKYIFSLSEAATSNGSCTHTEARITGSKRQSAGGSSAMHKTGNCLTLLNEI